MAQEAQPAKASRLVHGQHEGRFDGGNGDGIGDGAGSGHGFPPVREGLTGSPPVPDGLSTNSGRTFGGFGARAQQLSTKLHREGAVDLHQAQGPCDVQRRQARTTDELPAGVRGADPCDATGGQLPSTRVPLPSMTPTVEAISSTPAEPATPAPSADGSVVSERGSGVTLMAGDNGGADLDGGRYRVAWHAPACSILEIEWAPTVGASIPVAVSLPSGETFVELPAGPGFLNRVADCDYSVRFETAA